MNLNNLKKQNEDRPEEKIVYFFAKVFAWGAFIALMITIIRNIL